ncbi:transmembrane protein [Cystoisospora suis]|uniref:Transmembrane protein n=1 Tax=Cystoisospora suis TaxID=483139 RepID=A0A2C6KL40_9APIC|nr:transmembrane protein [Cystoisospora suis]
MEMSTSVLPGKRETRGDKNGRCRHRGRLYQGSVLGACQQHHVLHDLPGTGVPGRGFKLQQAVKQAPPSFTRKGYCHCAAEEDRSGRLKTSRQLGHGFDDRRALRWPSPGCGMEETVRQKTLTRRFRVHSKRGSAVFFSPLSSLLRLTIFFLSVFGILLLCFQDRPFQINSRGPVSSCLAMQVVSQGACRPHHNHGRSSPLHGAATARGFRIADSYRCRGKGTRLRCSMKRPGWWAPNHSRFFTASGKKKRRKVYSGLSDFRTEESGRYPRDMRVDATRAHFADPKYVLQGRSDKLKYVRKRVLCDGTSSEGGGIQSLRGGRLCGQPLLFCFIHEHLRAGDTTARCVPVPLVFSSLQRFQASRSTTLLSMTVPSKCPEEARKAGRATTDAPRFSASLLCTPEVAATRDPPERGNSAGIRAQGRPEPGQGTEAETVRMRTRTDSKKKHNKACLEEGETRARSGRKGPSVQCVEEAFVRVVEAVLHAGSNQDFPSDSTGFMHSTRATRPQSPAASPGYGSKIDFRARLEETAETTLESEPEKASAQSEGLDGCLLGAIARAGDEAERGAKRGGAFHCETNTDCPYPEVSPIVREAVANFRRAAQELLGIPVAARNQKDELRSEEALKGGNVHSEERGKRGSLKKSQSSGRASENKSCVWFDLTKQRLMVDRNELMRQLGEPAKGGWTLRFLGTGSMQPSVTRNTSAILFTRGDGISWLFDCGGGASAAAFPPLPSSATRSRLSPLLERLLGSAWSERGFPPRNLLTIAGQGSGAPMASKTRRERELERQRQHAVAEHLLRQPREAAALSVAAGAIADRSPVFESGGTEESEATGQLAPPQSARKKRVSRIGKIFVTHLHGDHSLGIPSLLSQVAAGPPVSRVVKSAERPATAPSHGTKLSSTHGPEGGITSDNRSRTCSCAPAAETESQPPRVDNIHVCANTLDKTVQEADSGKFQHTEGTEDQQDGDADAPVVDIFGPEGLRNLLRAHFVGTYVRRSARYRVHELKNVPCLHHGGRCTHPTLPELPKPPFEEEGSDILPRADGTYEVFSDGRAKVLAVPIRHTVPTVGYVVQEVGEPRRRLNAAYLQPLVKKNWNALLEWAELKGQPKAVFKVLSALQPGESFTFPDGTRVGFDEAFEEEAEHLRKFCLCVDTCDASPMMTLANNCDLLIHESTLSGASVTPVNEDCFDISDSGSDNGSCDFPGSINHGRRPRNVGDNSPTGTVSGFSLREKLRIGAKQLRTVTDREAFSRGHSTAAMAGEFAARVGACRLVLTHFSQRYKGDASLASVAAMKQVEHEAV